MDDSAYFVKYESNSVQLPIGWINQTPEAGTFLAGNVKMKGRFGFYSIPDSTANYWISDSGEVVITKREGKIVFTTFNGTLEKMVNGVPYEETLIVKTRVFSNGIYC
ncbi:hypothetical protein OAB47_04885 [Vicingaceae bacterium]|nr:hypothetical protein [Vicingaceae bacterium]